MNGLPPDIDLTALVGAAVSQICFSVHQCILKFDNDAQIAVESTCVLTSPSGSTTLISSYPSAATELCSVLEVRVRSAAREPDGGLVIHLENGAALSIWNDVLEYEAFQVHIGKTVYVA